jgi:hypothetical protein
VAPRPAHGRASLTQVLGTASSPAHRVRSCGRCLCNDKIKYKYGRGIYIYEIWLSVVTCYKNYGTPLNSTGAPVTRTRYALASEIGLLTGHACVLARPLRRGSKNNSWYLTLSDVVLRKMHVVGRSILVYSRPSQRNSDGKKCTPSLRSMGLGSRLPIALLTGKTDP